MNDMKDILQNILKLSDNDLSNLIYAMQNVKAVRGLQGETPETEVKEELPALDIPSEYLMPALEFLFMTFLRTMGENFQDDYKTQIFNQLTNNNNLKVSTYFDTTGGMEGQYPKAIVKCEDMSFSSEFLSDVSENAEVDFGNGSFGVGNAALMSCSFRIDVIDQTYAAANILGSIICNNLAANLDILREVLNLQQIGFPRLMGAQRVREFGDLFMASITFTCLKQVRWYDKYKEKQYKYFVSRILAHASGEDTSDIYSAILSLSMCRGLPLNDSIINSVAQRGPIQNA